VGGKKVWGFGNLTPYKEYTGKFPSLPRAWPLTLEEEFLPVSKLPA